jgi:subtilase family serine protease
MSFGGPELGLFPAANKGEDLRWEAAIEDTLFLQGLSQGITFVASSGDHGAIPVLGSTNKPTLGVECPACDPNVIAVGGTNLETAFSQGSNNSAYAGENANDDPEKTPAGMVWGSGGGMSQIWIKPDYQKPPTAAFTTPGTGRTVPDLALHMGGCPSDAKTTCGAGETGLNAKRSGDLVWIGGTFTPVIGTSASSPDIAGVIALMVSLTGGRLGFMNPYIYEVEKALGAKAFHHAAISGNNGHYAVKAPYDMVIGNGTLDVREFMSKVANGASLKMPPSGIPGNVNGTNP